MARGELEAISPFFSSFSLLSPPFLLPYLKRLRRPLSRAVTGVYVPKVDFPKQVLSKNLESLFNEMTRFFHSPRGGLRSVPLPV